jgi:hypothetical protein
MNPKAFVCVCICVCVCVCVCVFDLAVINLQLERKEWGLNVDKGDNPAPSTLPSHIRTYACLEPEIRYFPPPILKSIPQAET